MGGRSIVCKDVHQTVEIVEEHDKFFRLLERLRQHVSDEFSAIVFVSKQEKADSLLEDLMQAFDPNCLVLHGGIDRDDRISTFSSFKKGKTKVLVATSVAARGLDVKNCVCVVNYDCPNHYEDYVHRCGRTGRAGNKGFAYTFITPDQGQHAADIIKAFELSANSVPEKLQKLWDTYKEEAERTGKKIWTSSGFSGRGFKFDEAEAQLVNEKKKYQKKSLGMQNSSDEEDEADGGGGGGGASETSGPDARRTANFSAANTAALESEIKALVGARGLLAKPVVKVIGGSKNAAPAPMPPGLQESPTKHSRQQQQAFNRANSDQNQPQANIGDQSKPLSKLELIKQRAEMLCRQKGLSVPAVPSSLPQLATPSVANNPTGGHRSIVPNPAEPQVPIGVKLATKGDSGLPEAGGNQAPGTRPEKLERLEMQMEINDFHQQVRRRLTSKDTLNKVSENCEVGITVRGQFCPPGDRPNEPKLYLAIEGTSKVNLDNAHTELLLVVKDEYNRIHSQPAGRGRFKMV